MVSQSSRSVVFGAMLASNTTLRKLHLYICGLDDAGAAPIFAHDGDALRSVIEPGVLGIPVLKHLHHTWPHYAPDGSLYLLIHGWSEGKFAVLKHEPQGSPSVPRGWHYWKPEDRGF